MTELPQVFTSRWANQTLAVLECVPVGISRGTPRFKTGYRYRLARELAPDNATWAQDDEQGFTASYRRQLARITLEAILGRLNAISQEAGGLPPVLLCFEDLGQSDEWCHRIILARWLEEQTGIVVPELEAGMLPRRPDTPQSTLF